MSKTCFNGFFLVRAHHDAPESTARGFHQPIGAAATFDTRFRSSCGIRPHSAAGAVPARAFAIGGGDQSVMKSFHPRQNWQLSLRHRLRTTRSCVSEKEPSYT